MLAVVAFAACEQAPIEEQSVIRQEASETITVGFEGDDTRIQLNEAQKTVWTKDDIVSVFYKSNANQKWEYRGETGERVAELYRVDAGTASRDMDYVVLAYPYSTEYVISTATGNLETMLPAVQHYAVDSYGIGDNLMVSCSEFTQFSLKSVCGWLKLQLTGNGEVVKGIKFRGNNGEQVAGLIHVDTKSAEATLYSEEVAPDDNGNANGSLVIDGAMATEVMLYCDEGVTLSSEATAFYIALPPQTFEEGFTVDIICTDGTLMAKSSDKKLSIERNHIQPMAAFEFAATGTTDVPTEPENPVNPNLPSNENNKIYYTTTDGKKMFPTNYGVTTFGAILISNIYQDGVGVMTFDDDVTTIGEDAFDSCKSLTSVTIPDSVTTIGDYAFYKCSSLTSVNIPDSVTTIGEGAFAYCDSLTSVTIGDSVTTIGWAAFQNCTSLTSVNIGDSVTEIGVGAFIGCFSLTKFKGKFATEDGRSLIMDNEMIAYANASGTTYTIPDSVTSIGMGAFYYCESLTSVNIGESVTTIGDYAFYYCDSLTSVTIGDSVTEIGDSAFSGCTSLTSVTIPDSVTTIGSFAFYSCTSLTSVYCKATTPPSLGFYAFKYWNGSDDVPYGCDIYVPAESVDAYKSAQYWSEYASMIVSDPMVYTVLGSYDPNKYITYVEDYDYRGYGDAYDYNVYYYGTTIYSDGLLFSSKVECKFRLNSFSSGTFYISVGEYDDDIYDIYINTSGLNIGDELYTWGDMGVSKTDVITLTLSGTTMVVNGKTISGIPSVGRYLDGYIWSGHYHERDDGMWWMDYTFQDGARIYYAKGWNSAGDLIYLGGASLSADGRACWKSTYSEYGTGNIITEEHFPRVTSSFGRGNL